MVRIGASLARKCLGVTRCRMSRRNRQRHQFQAPGQVPRRRVMHSDSTGKRVDRSGITLQRADLAISPCGQKCEEENKTRHVGSDARRIHALIARTILTRRLFFLEAPEAGDGADEGGANGRGEITLAFSEETVFAIVLR